MILAGCQYPFVKLIIQIYFFFLHIHVFHSSTHTSLAGRDAALRVIPRVMAIISTHTPLAGRDHFRHCSDTGYRISTHTPLAGRDSRPPGGRPIPTVFLLTRPLRDVTLCIFPIFVSFKFLLTRPLRDVTVIFPYRVIDQEISTHTPLAGRDNWKKMQKK